MLLLAAISLFVWLYAVRLYISSRSVLYPSSVLSYSVDKTEPTTNIDSITLMDQPSNMFTFVQISDIHISRSNSHGGIQHFASFLANELPLIAPDLLFLSGDLIDAKTPSKLVSEQYWDEWVAYQALINSSQLVERNSGKFYFDQRGNHDCFNIGVPFEESEYARMSVVKKEGWIHIHRKSFGTYSFGALDGCPRAGMSRPINFFGTLDSTDMNSLAAMLDVATESNHNHTFVATHYPTSTMVIGKSNDGRTFQQLASGVSLWVSGHLHKLVGNLTMYGYHQRLPLLEMELGDMKDNALYRIVAVDNDFLAISDETLSLPQIPSRVTHDIKESPPPFPLPSSAFIPRPPIILVTNPRDARFATPTHEPTHRILTSTHIRALIYSFSASKSPIDPAKVSIRIDNVLLQVPVRYTGTTKPWGDIRFTNETANHLPLYAAKWEPRNYNDGRDHELTISATDENGTTATKTIIFRVDGQRPKTHAMRSGVGGYVIAAHFENLLKGLFAFAHICITTILLAPKLVIFLKSNSNTYPAFHASLSSRLHTLNTSLIRTSSTSTLLSMEQGSPARNTQPTPMSNVIRTYLEKMTIVWILRFLNFAQTPQLFYPFYFYLQYILVGPWFIGNLVPSAHDTSRRVGLFYIYGIWFTSKEGWVPILDTWYIALWEHTFFIFPLLLVLASTCPPQSPSPPQRQYYGVSAAASRLAHMVWAFVFVCWISLATYFGFFGWTYGWISVFLSPGKMWMTGWAVWVLGFDSVVERGRKAWYGRVATEVQAESDTEDDEFTNEQSVVAEEGNRRVRRRV